MLESFNLKRVSGPGEPPSIAVYRHRRSGLSDFLNPRARSHGQLNGKEENMLNRQMIVPVFLIGMVGLIIALTVNAAEVQKININTASAEELAQLKGIGPSHAAKIVAYREKNGPFKMPEDLVQVSGIGQKTFEAHQELIIGEETNKK